MVVPTAGVADRVAQLLPTDRRSAGLLLAYAAVTLVTLGLRYRQYADTSSAPWVPIARAAAAGIYLNFALLLLPMLRLTLSWPRLSGLRRILPVSQAVQAHMIAGNAIVLFSAIHVLAYAAIVVTKRLPLDAILIWPVPLTGVVLVVLLALLAVFAWLRERVRFELFVYTHFLAIPIGILSIVHAHWFFAVMLVPGIVYGVDRALRLLWSTRTAQVDTITADGRDFTLTLLRPETFAYRAGDYAFLCVPQLSRLQWHPFSLINAPNDTGSLAFRIRRRGAWTQAVARLQPGTQVLVDGPFASPCRELYTCRTAIIVAAGIGITPFASYLAQLESECAGGGDEPRPFDRIHLYWLERDQESLAGFYPLIARLHEQLGGQFTASLVVDTLPHGQVAPLVSHGSIDWDTALVGNGTQWQAPTVFFCGPKALSDRVRASCRRVQLPFVTESF